MGRCIPLDIYNRKNEMRGKIYSEMLYKKKQKLSTGLSNRVIMRKGMKNKSRNHVNKLRAFSKGRTISELTFTSIRSAFIESRNKLVFGHNPQTLTTGIVRMFYLQDMEHIRYNIRCDNYACTSNAREEMRYWSIDSVHIGVKLLYDHGGTSDLDVTKWLPTPTVNDSG